MGIIYLKINLLEVNFFLPYLVNMKFYTYLLCFLFINCPSIYASPSQKPPSSVGLIADQSLSTSTDCGPDSLNLDLTPYFNSYGAPLTYCLSKVSTTGSPIETISIQLDPFTGLLSIPAGWFAGPYTTIKLKIIAKNGFGSASQTMNVFLEACGG